MKAVPNPAYAKARYEIGFTRIAGDVIAPNPVSYPWRYDDYAAVERHLTTGQPQPGSIVPFLLETDD